MKMSYTNLLGEYNELFSNQPDEVKETIAIGKTYVKDNDIQTVLEYLSSGEIQYTTYSHS